jgi:hypothetical protein
MAFVSGGDFVSYYSRLSLVHHSHSTFDWKNMANDSFRFAPDNCVVDRNGSYAPDNHSNATIHLSTPYSLHARHDFVWISLCFGL